MCRRKKQYNEIYDWSTFTSPEPSTGLTLSCTSVAYSVVMGFLGLLLLSQVTIVVALDQFSYLEVSIYLSRSLKNPGMILLIITEQLKTQLNRLCFCKIRKLISFTQLGRRMCLEERG